jgi:predicted trehalose synthase
MNHATMEESRMIALWATLQPARLAHPSSYMLARAVDELGYELHRRPDWVELPLQGILQLMGRRTPP